jgi:hypothetical protein
LHVKPGKGAAFVRSKMKNYLTGKAGLGAEQPGQMQHQHHANAGSDVCRITSWMCLIKHQQC